ncbi:MAG: cell division protein FtsL [Candidatus Wallbacteria bacterium]|nr:cell division protein FtsL [Candidatus Wallbacteria bacterium]
MNSRTPLPKRTIAAYCTAITVLSLFLIFYVWQFTIIVEKKSLIRDLKDQNLELERKLASLEQNYHQLSSVARIEKIAKDKLHMVYPEKIQFITIPSK